MTREPRRDSKRIIAAREQTTRRLRSFVVDRACYLAVKAALFPREGRG